MQPQLHWYFCRFLLDHDEAALDDIDRKSSPLPVSTESNHGATMGGWMKWKTESSRCV